MEESFVPAQNEVWQSFICKLTGLDSAAAPLSDGPSAAVEAMRICVKVKNKSNDVIVAASLPEEVVAAIEAETGLNVVVSESIAEDVAEGVLDLAGVIVPTINRYGAEENHRALADLVHEMGGLLVIYGDIPALAVTTSPAEWGADIAAGGPMCNGISISVDDAPAAYVACRAEYEDRLPVYAETNENEAE